MFNKLASFITSALVVSGVAFAAPASTEVEARDEQVSVNINLCVDFNNLNCVIVPVNTDTCVNLTNGLSGWNEAISSVFIPIGFVCTFFDNFSCLSFGTGDSIVLQGGTWPSFSSVPGDGHTVNFNDRTSSFTCSPLIS